MCLIDVNVYCTLRTSIVATKLPPRASDRALGQPAPWDWAGNMGRDVRFKVSAKLKVQAVVSGYLGGTSGW